MVLQLSSDALNNVKCYNQQLQALGVAQINESKKRKKQKQKSTWFDRDDLGMPPLVSVTIRLKGRPHTFEMEFGGQR